MENDYHRLVQQTCLEKIEAFLSEDHKSFLHRLGQEEPDSGEGHLSGVRSENGHG